MTHLSLVEKTAWGTTENSWLLSRHAFSFGSYHNLSRLNFGTLRVFNVDKVEPHKGFSKHRHENMEILTIVLKGALEHEDNTGNKQVLGPLSVQRMSAGKGIVHAEFNAGNEPVEFLQMWIYPKERDIEPSYEEKQITKDQVKGKLVCVASGDESNETALYMHQDASVYLTQLSKGQSISHTINQKNSGVFLYLIDGELEVGETTVHTGDGVEITSAAAIDFQAKRPSTVVLVEVGVTPL